MRSIRVGLRFPADAPFDLRPVGRDLLRQRAPHEVQKSETMNYRTMAPEPGGLFDPTLFGPGTVIDAPVPASDEMIRPRRTWFARVVLAAPMVHPLLVAHSADEIGQLVGVSGGELEKALGRGDDEARALVATLEQAHPWAVIREVAVLPPDLRPLKLDEHMRWALTPLNQWYQRIIDRNARLVRELERGTPPAQLESDFASIRAAMRCLAENDEMSEPVLDPDGDPMPSLRTLAGGTEQLVATLTEIAERGGHGASASAGEMAAGGGGDGDGGELASNERVLARHYIARGVLFAMGFELAPKSASR